MEPISNSHISLSFSSGIETINTFIRSGPVVPSKTIPDFRPKWAKCIPFSDQNGTKPYLMGRHIIYSLYKGVPQPRVQLEKKPF